MSDLTGERVVVVGMQASGRAAAALAASRGADVVGVDLREDVLPIPGVRLELGPHQRATFLGADRIVMSPGVPASQPDVVAAREAGVPVIGELGFAASFLGLPMIAITGTNGKSTTTHFTGQVLRAAGYNPFVGGNLGNPLSNAVGGPWDCAVVEVSSYQLEFPGDFHPRVGVVLNLTPDHLARHGDMATYGATKLRLFQHMTADDWAFLPSFDERLVALAAEHGTGGQRGWLGALPGAFREDRLAVIGLRGPSIDLDLSGVTVPGAHNLDNATTAALLALAFGAHPDRVQEALPTLEALPHRMQIVRQDQFTWIDDSKATNVEASATGIAGIEQTAVVLLGGQAKGKGFAALAPILGRHRAVITFGGDGEAIADELEAAGVTVTRAGSMADAVDRARDLAEPGDAVLLSPGCASFDAFQNFEHRGRVFADLAAGESP